MFLNTRMKKPITSDRDVECFVYVRRYDQAQRVKNKGLKRLFGKVAHKCDPKGVVFTKYYEPFRNVERKPGATIKSKSARVYSGEYNGRNHYRVDDGFVNGMLRCDDDYGTSTPYKAIIPSGTEFYVNNGLFRIASRQMEITREKVGTPPSWHDVIEPINELLANELFGEGNEVSPGFYYMADGTYENPNNLTSDKTHLVSGIVSAVGENTVTIISLDENIMPWGEFEHPVRICSDSDRNLSGEEIMLNLMRNEHYGDDFVSARWCSKYEVMGGMRGNWHMGSIQEVISAVRENMMEINVAISLLGEQFRLIDSLSLYWTSVDSSDEFAYAIDGTDGSLVRSEKTTSLHKVRAFMTKIKPNPLFS